MFRSIITIVATLAVSGFVHAQNAVQWTQAEGGNGHWYQVITVESGFPSYNPEAYFDLAESAGGYAVTITSEEEDIFVYNFSLTVPGAWTIGNGAGFGPTLGARHLGGCSFEWVTGEPWSYASWGPADPGCNGGYVAYCVCGQSTPNETERWWADVDPSYGGNLSGVIEYSADCNDDGIVDYGQILDGSLTDENGNGVPDCCDNDTLCSAYQWKVEDGGNGHWYQLVLGSFSWPDAAAHAESLGGHMATLTNEAENGFVGSLPLMDIEGGYIGATSSSGSWQWITGEPWEFTSWDCTFCQNTCQPDYSWEIYATSGCYYQGQLRWGNWGNSQHPPDFCCQANYVIEWEEDCNDDGIVDYGQILDGTLEDLDGNGIPDCCDQGYACFSLDCNNNGIDDAIDIGNGTSQDCNANGIPDECDLANGDSEDCNSNGTPDECESLGDCDNDGTPDVCEILNGAVDANPADGIPDGCQGLPLGACCYNGGCLMSTFDDCFSAGGSFAGNGIGCADANCPTTCAGDVNGDNQVGIIDLLTIIDGWGFCP